MRARRVPRPPAADLHAIRRAEKRPVCALGTRVEKSAFPAAAGVLRFHDGLGARRRIDLEQRISDVVPVGAAPLLAPLLRLRLQLATDIQRLRDVARRAAGSPVRPKIQDFPTLRSAGSYLSRSPRSKAKACRCARRAKCGNASCFLIVRFPLYLLPVAQRGLQY